MSGLLMFSIVFSHAQVKNDSLDYNETYLPHGRDPSDPVYLWVEEMPIMVGGKKALVDFPECQSRDSIADVVIFKFVVETDSSFSDFRVVRSPDICFTNAARSYLEQMPPWQPGKRNGKDVPCLYTLPVMFRKK